MKKTIVIFGAGEGISFEVAKKFLENGFKVALISRNVEKLNKLKQELTKIGENISLHPCDVTDEDELNKVIDEILEANNSVNVVLYNAAKMRQGNILNESYTALIEDFKVNVAAIAPIVKRFKDPLSSAKGSLLITGGGIAIQPFPEYASLSLGKAALRNLTQSIRESLSPFDIFVGTIQISGAISKETHLYHPRHIAELFWSQHVDRSSAEIIL